MNVGSSWRPGLKLPSLDLKAVIGNTEECRAGSNTGMFHTYREAKNNVQETTKPWPCLELARNHWNESNWNAPVSGRWKLMGLVLQYMARLSNAFYTSGVIISNSSIHLEIIFLALADCLATWKRQITPRVSHLKLISTFRPFLSELTRMTQCPCSSGRPSTLGRAVSVKLQTGTQAS